VRTGLHLEGGMEEEDNPSPVGEDAPVTDGLCSTVRKDYASMNDGGPCAVQLQPARTLVKQDPKPKAHAQSRARAKGKVDPQRRAHDLKRITKVRWKGVPLKIQKSIERQLEQQLDLDLDQGQQQQQQQVQSRLHNEMHQLRQQLEEQRRTMQADLDAMQMQLRVQERLLQKVAKKVDEQGSRVSTLELQLQRERSRGQMTEKQLREHKQQQKQGPTTKRPSAVPAPSVSPSDSGFAPTAATAPGTEVPPPPPSISAFATSSSSSSSSSSWPSDPASNAARKRPSHGVVGDAISSWTCSSCTFSNINEQSTRCQVCESPRHKYQRQSARLDHDGFDSTENENGNGSLMDTSDLVI
jgi:hypothetical protein